MHRRVHIRETTAAGQRKTIEFRTQPHPNGTITRFYDRNWNGRWYAWRVLKQFGAARWNDKNWNTRRLNNDLADILLRLVVPDAAGNTEQDEEYEALFAMARDERASALGEILTQDVEFITAFMEALAMTPGSHYRTFRMLHIASLMGSFAALHYKHVFDRPRPSWEMPALMPPVPVPGHSSFPSGHSTQAHLMAMCMGLVFDRAIPLLRHKEALKETLNALARRVARNREIAGLHYRSDSEAGEILASHVLDRLNNLNSADMPNPALGRLTTFADAVDAAVEEWTL